MGKKIVVIATVKNEADIIESFCRYNLSFSDVMLIRENHQSTDNTREIIQNLISEGLPIYFEVEEDMYYESSKSILARIAVEKYNADLVVQLDADEFLCHVDGINPRKTLEGLEEDVEYQLPWRTYIYEREPDKDNIFIPQYFSRYRNQAFENLMGYAGKTLLSRYLIEKKQAYYTPGAHWLEYPQEHKDSVRVVISDVLVCAHYPIRNKKQVMQKAITNYVNKWALPESQRFPGEVLAAYQLGTLYEVAKVHGDIPADDMKRISLTYSFNKYYEKNKLNELMHELGDNVTISYKIVTSFCDDLLVLRYTKYCNDDNKALFKAILNRIDDALFLLDDESRKKTKIISEREVPYSDLKKRMKEIEEHRDALQIQINELYASWSWRVGHKLMQIASFFIPWKR